MLPAVPPTPHRRYWEPRVNVQEEPMRRRRFIAAALTATGIGTGLTPPSLSAAAVEVPDRLNGSTTLPNILTDLEADIWRTGAEYVAPHSAPARAELLDVALWQWAQATSLANRVRRPYHRRQAYALHAEAARQVAMIHADRFNYTAATKFYTQASLAARRADDWELAAWISTSRAYMPLYSGNYRRVTELTSQALAELQHAPRPGGRAAACAHALRARSYAAQGARPQAEDALTQAHAAMAASIFAKK